MAKENIGFIGGGNMAEAIIKGLLKANVCTEKQLCVSDIRKERLDYLEATYSVKTFTNTKEMIKVCPIIIIAVKPQDVKNVLEEIKEEVSPSHLVISIAAGISTMFIESLLPQGVPVVRIMPNTPALALAGMSALTSGKAATTEHLNTANKLFKAIGETVIVPEKLMDAVTGLSGSGPAYIAVIIEALADGGVKMGLPRPVALKLALQTVLGTAKLLQDTNLHPAQLKDMVSSPGGTTIAGLQVMEKRGLRGILIDTIEAATKRSQELGG
ncbi:MAG: pyrroline-5-carboxylate reductase [Candidatus Desulfofervidaceae bacterium]|nr:pyrroline-5-carboxylate reductase [Candidatus Desulfofervidaceae bacterium]